MNKITDYGGRIQNGGPNTAGKNAENQKSETTSKNLLNSAFCSIIISQDKKCFFFA